MKYMITLATVWLLIIQTACKKFLNEKPRQSLAIAVSLQDFQALLDHHPTMLNVDPGAAEISADDYYLNTADYNTLAENFRRMYVWQPDQLFAPNSNDWFNVFRPVYRCNMVLEGISNVPVTASNQFQWNDVKGQAHFYRAKSYLQAAYIWTLMYDKNSAAIQPGLPLRLNTDFNTVSVRNTVEETFQQIIEDAKQATFLLPVTVQHCVRPSRAAACALLARAYLAMSEYDSCFKYANASLQLKNTLIDYNNVNAALSFPFQSFPDNSNPEILHLSYMPNPAPVNPSRAKVDSLLYGSYTTNDLRKIVFFKNNNNSTFSFKGSYQSNALFSGIATDEVILMRAECYARKQDATAAMNDLNTLLIKRWKTGTFIPFTASTPVEALDLILLERRKELLMRGLRFIDIKRLNKEGLNNILLRNINNTTYSLPPDDLRYALPIPEDVIALSGMQQNPR